MGTKSDPSPFNGFEKAEPDEPMFVLLGRDSLSPKLIREWAEFRLRRLPNFGRDHPEERAQIDEATRIADDMQAYHVRLQKEKNRKRIEGEKASMKEGAEA